MARIAGVELPSQKRVEIGLTYIYGIGKSSSNEILHEAGINPGTRVKDLTESEINAIQTIIQRNFRVEGELRRIVQGNVKRLIDIGSYRGIRHRRGLPVRGQRTRTNARTKRGRRKTVGTVKKEEVEVKEGEE
jgi:small subunit ribosomal protein S13